MRRCEQVTAADWVVRAAAPWWQLATFGPPGFEAYARLRLIPDPERAGQSEADVVLPDDHPTDLEQAGRALRRLADVTAPPDEYFFCEWDGYGGDWLTTDLAAPLVELAPTASRALRRYGLFAGPFAGLEQWEDEFGHAFPPAFVWPADRSWCFACDVDPHWAGIGASRAAIDALIAMTDLDVVEADPAADQPAYR